MSFVVLNTNDSGAGSLRQAILDANAVVGVQTISFDIPGSGVQTIAPTSDLPAISDPVIIDGYTQPGASPNTLQSGDNAVLLIELSGSHVGTNSATASGLLLTGGGSTVEGLVINDFIPGDRTHPSDSGRLKVARQLLDFLQRDPTAVPWFMAR